MAVGHIANDVHIELVQDAKEAAQCFYVACAAFSTSNDVVFDAFHPGHKTEEGRRKDAEGMSKSFEDARRTKRALCSYVKATVPAPSNQQGNSDDGKRVIAGFAIWNEASMLRNPPSRDLPGVDKRYAGNETGRDYANSVYKSFMRHRIALLEDIAPRGVEVDLKDQEYGNDERAPPAPGALMVLELIGVHPEHQRKGIARLLVQWGLDRAKARSDGHANLEAVLEGSPMGRHVYSKMGFHTYEHISFDNFVRLPYLDREMPDLLWMRTAAPEQAEASSQIFKSCRDSALGVAHGTTAVDSAVDEMNTAICGPLREAMQDSDQGQRQRKVQDVFWNLSEGVVSSVRSVPIHWQSRTLKLLSAMKETWESTDEICQAKAALSEDAAFPLLGAVCREELDTEETGQKEYDSKVRFHAFEAKATAQGLIDLSLHGLWALREALENGDLIFKADSESRDSQNRESYALLAAAAAWVLFAPEYLYSLSEKAVRFPNNNGLPGSAFESKDWHGYNKERYSLWKVQLARCVKAIESHNPGLSELSRSDPPANAYNMAKAALSLMSPVKA